MTPQTGSDSVGIDALIGVGAKKRVLQAIRKTVPATPPADSELEAFAQRLDEAIAGE